MVWAALGGAGLGAFGLALTRVGGVKSNTMAALLISTGVLGASLYGGRLRAASLGLLAAGASQWTTGRLEQAYQAAVKQRIAGMFGG